MRDFGRLLLCVVAGFGALTESAAEDVARRFRLAVQVGGHNALDEVRNDSANAMLITDDSGAIIDQFLDPRSDTSALGTLEIRPGNLVTLSAQYAVTSFFILEASVGQENTEIGDIEVHEVMSGTLRRFSAGDLTRIPIQLTGIVRFRPSASFNPFVGVGIGYSTVDFNLSTELDELSVNMSNSIGGRGLLSTVNAGGLAYPCGGCPSAGLSGVSVATPDSLEWHLSAGAEYSFGQHWALFVDLRYVFAERTFGIEFNDGVPIGIPVPNVTRVRAPPLSEWPGPMFVTTGGLIDVDGDGAPDLGAYYVQDGRFKYDGPSVQFGVRYTF